MDAVFGFAENQRVLAFKDFLAHFADVRELLGQLGFGIMKGGQAMQEGAFLIPGLVKHCPVDLIAFQQFDPFGDLFLFTHGSPDIGINNIGILDAAADIIGNGDFGLPLLGEALAFLYQFLGREKGLRCHDAKIHAHFGRPDHQGIGHVVAAVAHIGEDDSLQPPLGFEHGHEIGQDLGGVVEIGQPVPDRDPGVLRQPLHGFMLEAAELDAIEHPAQNARRVLDRFLFPQLDVVLAQVFRVGAFINAGHHEGAAGTG